MSDSLRKQQFQAILELGVELQAFLQESKSCTVPIPCPRETWIHLSNPLRTPLIASLTPQGNMMGLHCKTPKFLRTHVRSERKRKTDFPEWQAKPSLRAPCPATLTRTIRTTPTCVKHQHTKEEILGSKSRLPTTCTTYYFLNSDYSDEVYSDDEYSRDPYVDNLYRNSLN
jgi:hypothetical protein